METKTFIKQTRRNVSFFSSRSWGWFGVGIGSLIGLSVSEYKFEPTPTTASVRSSWIKVGNLLKESYVKETTLWK